MDDQSNLNPESWVDAVIPGAAKRRPGIQSADETLWFPAFAGMTKKLDHQDSSC
jgi:hypothetical protein